jgi:L-seryl-tRNA(Ser) seleniumtransferase
MQDVSSDVHDPMRSIPSIDELLRRPQVTRLLQDSGRELVVSVLREMTSEVRRSLLAGQAAALSELEIERRVALRKKPFLRGVVNATGVVLHTNLGRAPLAPSVMQQVLALGQGYCNLEFDLDDGERGDRYAPVIGLLRTLTGAEDAMVVNNCAGAVMLMLSALAQGQSVVVSRGELIEIGGGFRIPDIMRESGARLIEVGTTNRTRLSDYVQAVETCGASLVMKVHRSNFSISGFTEEVTVAQLAQHFAVQRIPVLFDLGSGLLAPLEGQGLSQEMTVGQAIAAGADLVAVSGDKLLGGPQCGILVGKTSLLEKLKKHSLNRVLRIDKMTMSALEGTLRLYLNEKLDEIPVRKFLQRSSEELRRVAVALEQVLLRHGLTAQRVASTARVGGGCLPDAELPSEALEVVGNANLLEAQFRNLQVPVIGRITNNRFVLDVRCVTLEEVEAVGRALS